MLHAGHPGDGRHVVSSWHAKGSRVSGRLATRRVSSSDIEGDYDPDTVLRSLSNTTLRFSSLVDAFRRNEETRSAAVHVAILGQTRARSVTESYTACARNVLKYANEEARSLGHAHLGTEHLLIALAREEQGAAARVLSSLGFTADQLRNSVAFIAGRGQPLLPDNHEPSPTPRLNRVLESAAQEAKKRSHAVVSTLHLLLALLREREGLAVMLLESPGVGLERIGGALMRAFRDGLSDSI